ncbi:MAG: hypothetical protein JW894_00825 [Bacteroidales bacterium]|nr:hypothetical protein [Bacteroidales bacterium]
MLRHIALEIKESDLRDFYIEILGGKITREFTLNESDAKKIFNISGPLNVYELAIGNLKFELFIHDSLEQDSLQHICVQMDNPSEVFSKAIEMKYKTHLRKNNERETYFIKDNNGNLFEIKKKEECHEQFVS